ncbi:MAG: hypothetical protein WCE75_11525, partial [Terracidiphilus sp.]
MTQARNDDAVTAEVKRPDELRAQIARLPVTMRPSMNQQLAAWATLFPFEQKRLRGFLSGVASFSPPELEALTGPLRALEAKMEVARWNFSEAADTMENASQLARSPYYAEWRREVQRVFAAIDRAARDSAPVQTAPGRLVLLVLPESLPVPPMAGWKPWDARARVFRVAGEAKRIAELALGGATGLPPQLAAQTGGESADCWLIDADAQLGSLLPAAPPPVSLLDYATLKPFRDRFLGEVNTVPKDIQATDQTLAAVRRENWDRWWPASLAGQERLRSFVVELFLSGNGAMIFSNAFVEWAASEALR